MDGTPFSPDRPVRWTDKLEFTQCLILKVSDRFVWLRGRDPGGKRPGTVRFKRATFPVYWVDYRQMVNDLRGHYHGKAQASLRQYHAARGVLWLLKKNQRLQLDQPQLFGTLFDEKVHYQETGYAKDIAEDNLDDHAKDSRATGQAEPVRPDDDAGAGRSHHDDHSRGTRE